MNAINVVYFKKKSSFDLLFMRNLASKLHYKITTKFKLVNLKKGY